MLVSINFIDIIIIFWKGYPGSVYIKKKKFSHLTLHVINYYEAIKTKIYQTRQHLIKNRPQM